jgi:hypothetical protein
VVCCHFDGFGVTHYPVDPNWQADADKFFNNVIDPFVGRKQFWMFQQLGFTDITVEAELDRSFAVSGPIDKERRENWETQLKAALPALIRNLGTEERATEFIQQFLAYQDREDTFSTCILYFVKGRVP